ncbi:hypothetical protein D3C72_2306720 [compost metagenome]
MQFCPQLAEPRLEHQSQAGVHRPIQQCGRAALQQTGTEGVEQQHGAAQANGGGWVIDVGHADQGVGLVVDGREGLDQPLLLSVIQAR